MNVNGFNGPTFQTAARRRKGVPVQFKVEHWEPNDTGGGNEIEVILLVDPRVDIVRIGTAFGAFGAAMKQVEDPSIPAEVKTRVLDEETPKVRAALREMLLPPSRLQMDVVAESMDIRMLSDIVRHITKELSGLDPTQLASSPDGSPTTSSSSTDGAQLVESTSS